MLAEGDIGKQMHTSRCVSCFYTCDKQHYTLAAEMCTETLALSCVSGEGWDPILKETLVAEISI